MGRVSREWYYMSIAAIVAMRSTCPRAQVGCVIVSRNRVLATGYNGSPPGRPHCENIGCEMVDGHCVRTVHAEVSAAVSIHPWMTQENFIAYCTHEVCWDCTKILYSAGVRKIFFKKEYLNIETRMRVKEMLPDLEVKRWHDDLFSTP